MIADTGLHRIRTGEASPTEARGAIRDALAKNDIKAAAAIYGALRGWTWKAMQERRFDDELGEWFQVINAASAALRRQDSSTSNHLKVLAHLVDDSLRFAASHTRGKLVQRSHFGDILSIIRKHNGRIARDKLEGATQLAKTRLSQLLSELVAAGALERESEGKQASFILTDSGRELLDDCIRFRALRMQEAEARRVAPKEPDVVEEQNVDGEELQFALPPPRHVAQKRPAAERAPPRIVSEPSDMAKDQMPFAQGTPRVSADEAEDVSFDHRQFGLVEVEEAREMDFA